jgi:shikimate kinase
MLEVPVFLTGFMGVGKSKIGLLLAQRLGRVFLDTDQLVEARAGRTIARIFAEEGESRFRQLEHQCVQEAAARKDAVIALGGGAIAQERTLQLVRRAGVLVCLQADVETILERVSRNAERPLLAGLSGEEKRRKIERLLAERAPYYDQADLKIRSSEERTPEETAAQLVRLLENWSAQNRHRY